MGIAFAALGGFAIGGVDLRSNNGLVEWGIATSARFRRGPAFAPPFAPALVVCEQRLDCLLCWQGPIVGLSRATFAVMPSSTRTASALAPDFRHGLPQASSVTPSAFVSSAFPFLVQADA